MIYFVMPDRFANGDPTNDDPPPSRGVHDRAKSRYYHGGDFRGIIERLPPDVVRRTISAGAGVRRRSLLTRGDRALTN